MKPPQSLGEEDFTNVRAGVRVFSKRGPKSLGEVEASNVVLEANGDQPVPERLTVEADHRFLPEDEWGLLAADGQRLEVEAIIETRGVRHVIPQGEFLVQSWEETRGGGVSVTAHGMLQQVVDAPWKYATSPPVGATLLSEARRLAFPVPVVLDDVVDVRLPTGLSWGRDRLDALEDLGASMGVVWVMGADFCLHGRKRKSVDDVCMVYSDSAALLETLGNGDHFTPNEIVVWGRGRDGKSVHSYTARASDGRFDPRFYGVVREVSELESGATDNVVTNAAETRMSDTLRSEREFEAEIVCDPRIELWDVVGVARSETGGVRVGEVVGYTMPLTHVGTMRLRLRELKW